MGLADIGEHHSDTEASLRLYYSSVSPNFAARFLGYSTAEVTEELNARLVESQPRASLTLLTSLEAAFRIE